MGDEEIAYIQEELGKDHSVLLDWGFRGRQQLAPAKVVRVAMSGASKDVAGHRRFNRLLNQSRIAVPDDGSHPWKNGPRMTRKVRSRRGFRLLLACGLSSRRHVTR